jgi:uncharacterized membrane protein HdeD (DUF308 family)
MGRVRIDRFTHASREAVMTMNQPGHVQDLQRAVLQSIGEHWKFYLIEGIILVILGLIAIIVPPLATLAVAILIGWLFLISGVAGLIMTFMTRGSPGFWWSLLSGVLGIAAGLVLLIWPVSGAISLTFLLIAFFTIEGVLTIMFALEHKRELAGRWGWMLASGVVDLVLAVMILAGLPSSAAWAIGLLVGINMLFGGTSMIAMALHARPSAPATAKAA